MKHGRREGADHSRSMVPGVVGTEGGQLVIKLCGNHPYGLSHLDGCVQGLLSNPSAFQCKGFPLLEVGDYYPPPTLVQKEP